MKFSIQINLISSWISHHQYILKYTIINIVKSLKASRFNFHHENMIKINWIRKSIKYIFTNKSHRYRYVSVIQQRFLFLFITITKQGARGRSIFTYMYTLIQTYILHREQSIYSHTFWLWIVATQNTFFEYKKFSHFNFPGKKIRKWKRKFLLCNIIHCIRVI